MPFSFDELRKRVSEGLSQRDAISTMKGQGVSTIEAIKVVRELYSIDLGAAKQLVTSHDAYSSAAAAAAPLQNAILETLEEHGETNSESES